METSKFLGIKVPSKISETLFAELKKELLKYKDFIEIEAPENYHITLKYFGHIPLNKIDFKPIIDCQKQKPFVLEIEGLGQFNNRVLFVSCNSTPEIKNMIRILEPDKFTPHITVARNRGHKLNLKVFLPLFFDLKTCFEVDRIYLFENVKINKKKKYVALKEFVLGKQ